MTVGAQVRGAESRLRPHRVLADAAFILVGIASGIVGLVYASEIQDGSSFVQTTLACVGFTMIFVGAVALYAIQTDNGYLVLLVIIADVTLLVILFAAMIVRSPTADYSHLRRSACHQP